jgi:hypothetical protein
VRHTQVATAVLGRPYEVPIASDRAVLQELYFLHPHPRVAHVLTELKREIRVVQRDRKSRLRSIKKS